MSGAGEGANDIARSGRKRTGPALLVPMDPELYRLLKEHSERQDRPMVRTVRRALKEYLERQADYVAPY